MMTSETLVPVNHEKSRRHLHRCIRVASSTDRLKLEAMTEGLLITMLFCSTNFGSPSDHECIHCHGRSVCVLTHRGVESVVEVRINAGDLPRLRRLAQRTRR